MLGALLLKNPWTRALIPSALAGAVGLLANAVVAEITKNGVVVWEEAIFNRNLHWLLLASTLAFIYQIVLFRHDRALIAGFTPRQYEANIRNRVAESVAKRCQKLVRSGHIELLEKETETFKKLFGENK
ncbi:hypothetical protein H0A64_08025 [Alcaligenaceae bacterium]|nr:hypothetical protein [Alcaligenaceae bacterium]